MIRRIVFVAFLALLCHPFVSSAQDSIAVKDQSEEKMLQFQQYFFKALSEKSIKNYQKAIENLEFCNELSPNDTSVLFEFSKNYLLLNRIVEAKQYIEKALALDPDNIWMLGHLVAIYRKERNYGLAIEAQKKIIAQNPNKKPDLIRLYYLNRDYQAAMDLMNELEQEKGLSRNLKSLKLSLEFRKGTSVEKGAEDLQSLISSFEENASFALLKKVLEKSHTEDMSVFHTYSEKAIDLFPAQPYAYLMRGKSLQIQNQFQQAMAILESGIDFVIDNPSLEANFYEILAKVHDGLGNTTKAQEYRNKAKKLKAAK
jgi:tetratricopeptide (TPR) repeat protein